MDEWVQIIGNWGFPIALSIYLLIYQERKLVALTSAINALNNTMTIISERLKD